MLLLLLLLVLLEGLITGLDAVLAGLPRNDGGIGCSNNPEGVEGAADGLFFDGETIEPGWSEIAFMIAALIASSSSSTSSTGFNDAGIILEDERDGKCGTRSGTLPFDLLFFLPA